MQYKAIFFDLDGTLLPLEQEEFTRSYFAKLARVLAPYGVAPQKAIEAVMAGVHQMQKSDGSVLNEHTFWQTFAAVAGQDIAGPKQDCDAFYSGAFLELKACVKPNPLARQTVQLARALAGKVVLATNPVFPSVAQTARLSWIDLTPEDFDLITHYSNAHSVKPNPAYYAEICQQLGVAPAECLMVGNDELEDMYAASAAGLHCVLLTDYLLPSKDHPWDGPRYTYGEFFEKLQKGEI